MALPKGFKIPENESSDYTRLEPGENRLRLLTDLISGQTYWTGDVRNGEERKPVRKREGEKINLGEMGYGKYGPDKPKTFIAGVVWNYQTQKVEVFETDKWGIVSDIAGLEDDMDWGDTKNYDIAIKVTGSGPDTRYKVDPKPVKPVAPEIVSAFKQKHINLEALYDGGNPFTTNSEPHTSADIANDAAEALEGPMEAF